MDSSESLHGFMPKDAVPWDYATVPSRVWKELKRLPNGCWVAPTRTKARWFSMTMVERLTRKSAHDALAITPTCANQRCVNPSHLCVVWANAMSVED